MQQFLQASSVGLFRNTPMVRSDPDSLYPKTLSLQRDQ